jgi:excisionase family DNA binding protein
MGQTVTDRIAFTVSEAASMTGLSTDRIYQLCREGKFPHVRVGERQILIPRRKLERWLQDDADLRMALEFFPLRH